MVKVLFDNNMPAKIARAVHEIISSDGHESIALRDKFSPSISDVDFFTALGKDDNWVVISKDVANAKRAPERAAILRSGVLAFYLAPSVQRLKITEQTATILWQWEKMAALRATARNGLFQIPINKASKFETL